MRGTEWTRTGRELVARAHLARVREARRARAGLVALEEANVERRVRRVVVQLVHDVADGEQVALRRCSWDKTHPPVERNS